MTPTLRQFEIIRALAQARSFTRAAEGLRLSQSALSQAVAQTEAALGVRLFERTRRTVTVTPAASRFLLRAEAALDELQAATAALRREGDPGAGRVDLACLSSVAIRLLPPIVDAFRARHPGAVVRIRDDDPDGIVARVKSGDVDFALSCMFEEDGGVEFQPVLHDALRVVCRAGHALASRPALGWGDLADYDVVALAGGSGLRRMIDRALGGRDIFRGATYEVAKITTILDIVAQSDCVAVLPALALASPASAAIFHHRAMREPEIHREIGFILPPRALSATAAAFRDALAGAVRANPAARYPGIRVGGRRGHTGRSAD